MWSACSKTCGVGFRVRRRSCINPRLFPTGGLCNGLSIQHQSCFDRVCPGKKQAVWCNRRTDRLTDCLFVYLSVLLTGWLGDHVTNKLTIGDAYNSEKRLVTVKKSKERWNRNYEVYVIIWLQLKTITKPRSLEMLCCVWLLRAGDN